MARESALWQRLKGGALELRWRGGKVDLQRLENAVGTGHPDVEGCVDGVQIWIELKSEDRPKRSSTPVRPKLRPSQQIWHQRRATAGCRHNWVLLQVGEGRGASLYLIPGVHYHRLTDTEAELGKLSFIALDASPAEALLKAALGW